jgi:hypothetical protein
VRSLEQTRLWLEIPCKPAQIRQILLILPFSVGPISWIHPMKRRLSKDFPYRELQGIFPSLQGTKHGLATNLQRKPASFVPESQLRRADDGQPPNAHMAEFNPKQSRGAAKRRWP